ncbi:hypothetical protein CEK28_17855 [Xenophilus sp. AP218F]|nr:hypothetical protein CEK28_17855 [Xenophilus sp. AP218F]
MRKRGRAGQNAWLCGQGGRKPGWGAMRGFSRLARRGLAAPAFAVGWALSVWLACAPPVFAARAPDLASRIDLLLVDDRASGSAYVTTLATLPRKDGAMSGESIFGFSGGKVSSPFVWRQGGDAPAGAILKVSPSAWFQGLAGKYSCQGVARFGDLADADKTNPVFADDFPEKLRRLPIGHPVDFAIVRSAPGGEQTRRARVSKAAEVRLSSPAAPACRPARLNQQDGRICLVRAVAARRAAVSLDDARFTVRPRSVGVRGWFRAGGEWRRQGAEAPLKELMAARSVEVFVDDDARRRASQNYRHAGRQFDLVFYSASRKELGDRFHVSPEAGPSGARLARTDDFGLMLLNDHATRQRYVATVSSPGRAEGRWLGGAGRPVWRLFRDGGPCIAEVDRIVSFLPRAYFDGVTDGRGKTRQLDFRGSGFVNPLLSPAFVDDLAHGRPVPELSVSALMHDGRVTTYRAHASLQASLSLFPSAARPQPMTAGGVAGSVYPLRHYLLSGRLADPSVVRLLVVLPPAWRREALIRVRGGPWKRPEAGLDYADLAAGSVIELFVPTVSNPGGRAAGRVVGEFHFPDKAERFGVDMTPDLERR